MIIGNNKEVKKIYKDNEAIIGIKKGTLPIFSRGSIMESLLTLPAKITAATKKIKDLKIYGNTLQEGTPTPENPVNVNVVTGGQEIEVANGTETQTYTINLGNIELCKIGNYQDRIYKDNDKWYLNKQIGKVVLNGSESWNSYADGSDYFYLSTSILETTANYVDGYSSHFRCLTYYPNVAGTFAFRGGGKQLSIRVNGITSVANWKTWLSTHNTIVYYVLKEPTTTEITDTELISQLNAIELVNGDNYINSSSTYLQISQIFIKYRGE